MTQVQEAVVAERDRYRYALETISQWKEFFDRNVGSWDSDTYGPLTIHAYVRRVLDGE